MTTEPTAQISEEIKNALSRAGAFCGDCGFEPGDRGQCPDCERCLDGYARALIPVLTSASATTASRDQNTPWPALAGLAEWLDRSNGTSQQETTLRLLKVTEEAGEMAQAWIGYTGQNPRKGTTHTAEDVADELCDVAVTALVALFSIIPDPEQHFAGKLATIATRCSGGEPT